MACLIVQGRIKDSQIEGAQTNHECDDEVPYGRGPGPT